MQEKEIRLDNDKQLILYREDCFQLFNYLNEGQVDVVVTSPPYNIGVDYHRYDDNISREDYLQWLSDWASLMKKALSPEGSIFLNIGSKPSDPVVPFQVIEVMQEHFKLQNVIHWIKSIYIEEESYGEKTVANVGHYKPINSERFINDTHEYIFHLTRTGRVRLDRLAIGVPYKDKTNIERWQGKKSKEKRQDLRCRGNCWYIPYQTITSRKKDRPHPASYPPELAVMCIKLHGLEGVELVLDPFMGIGNTALACQELNINFIGFEIDNDYYQSALSLLIKQPTLFD